MQTQLLLLLLGVTVTSPLLLVMDHKLTMPRDNPNITRLEVSEHIFVIITHLMGSRVDSWVC